MLMLEAIGKLEECSAFPRREIDTELLNYLEKYDMLHSTDVLHDEEKLYMYEMVLPYLERRNRYDLRDELARILGNLRKQI